MDYIDGKPVLDFDDCVKYIVKDTGYNSEIVESILDSETRYMMKVGIILLPKLKNRRKGCQLS